MSHQFINTTNPDLQLLQGEKILLIPLHELHFESLFAAASDPLIWEQHPNPNRYQLTDFTTFFEGAMQSKGAFLILKNDTDEVVGSSRFYDYNPDTKSVLIGYTFITRKFWGGGVNTELKKLMIEYAFKHVDKVLFYVGGSNWRSQKAMERLGGVKIGEELIEYFGEGLKMNVVYEIQKK